MDDEWIRLNVGGVHFACMRSTLCAAEPSSVLSRMFAKDSPFAPARSVDGTFCLDADSECFKIILIWLRRKILVDLPASVTVSQLLAEADYFQLDRLVSAISDIYGRIHLEWTCVENGNEYKFKTDNLHFVRYHDQNVVKVSPYEDIKKPRGVNIICRKKIEADILCEHTNKLISDYEYLCLKSRSRILLWWQPASRSTIPESAVSISASEDGVYLGRSPPKPRSTYELGYVMKDSGLVLQCKVNAEFEVLCGKKID